MLFGISNAICCFRSWPRASSAVIVYTAASSLAVYVGMAVAYYGQGMQAESVLGMLLLAILLMLNLVSLKIIEGTATVKKNQPNQRLEADA